MEPSSIALTALCSWGLLFLSGCEKADESIPKAVVEAEAELVTNETIARIATAFVQRELVWKSSRGSGKRSADLFSGPPPPPPDESYSSFGESEDRPVAVVVSRYGRFWIGAVIGISKKPYFFEGNSKEECLCQIEGKFALGVTLTAVPLGYH